MPSVTLTNPMDESLNIGMQHAIEQLKQSDEYHVNALAMQHETTKMLEDELARIKGRLAASKEALWRLTQERQSILAAIRALEQMTEQEEV